MAFNISELHAALQDAFDIPSFSTLLQSLQPVSKRWDDFAGGATTFPDGLTNVIAKANAQGWIPQLLRAVVQSPSKNNPRVVTFFANNPDVDPGRAQPPLNPLGTLFVVGNRPFVGRDLLRTHAAAVGQGGNSRILLVDGGEKTGKTYTNDYLQYMAIHHPCLVRYVNLDAERFSLQKFAERLGDDLSLPKPIPAPDKEQDPRWSERLAKWVLAGTVDPQGRSFWLVFDGFAEQEHEPGVHELIGKLAELIDGPSASQATHFRLVLINYRARIPEALAASAFEEAIVTPERSDFENAFVQTYLQRQMSKAAATTAFATVYDQALAKAQQDPVGAKSWLKWLNIGVTVAVKRLGA